MFLRGSAVRLTWAVRIDATLPESVVLQYRAVDGDNVWHVIATVPASPSFRYFQLPDSLHGRFELRIQGSGDTVWDVLSPLYAASVVVRLSAPVTDQSVPARSVLPVRWDLAFPDFPPGSIPTDSGEVEIQYTLLGASPQWQTVARVPASSGRYDWTLPQTIDGDFALCARSTTGDVWSVVTPLHVLYYEILFTAPAADSKHRIGRKIHVGWKCETAVGANDRVILQYHEEGLLWQNIGSYPYSTLGTDWTPPASKGRKYGLRIRHENSPTWTEMEPVYTADIRIRDVPAQTVLTRGTALSIKIDVDLPWTSSKTFTLDMTTDDGASWIPALEGLPSVLH